MKNKIIILVFLLALFYTSFIIYYLEWQNPNFFEKNKKETYDYQNNQDFPPKKASSTALWSFNTDTDYNSIAISSNGSYIVVGTTNGNLYLFNKSSSTPIWINNSAGHSVDISSNGDYIAAANSKKVLFFERTSPNPLWYYPTLDYITGLTLSADGKYLIVSDNDEIIYLFNSTNQFLWNYNFINTVNDLDISSNGTYIAVASGYNIYLFNKSSSNPMKVWSATNDVNSVSISSDGNYIVAGSRDNKIYVFNKSSLALLWSFDAGSIIWSVSISTDGNYIVAGSNDYKTYLFHISKSFPLWNCIIGTGTASVDITSDGNYIVAGCVNGRNNGLICLFQKSNHIPLGHYDTNDQGVSVAISQDGKYIVAGSGNYVYFFHYSGFNNFIDIEIDFDENQGDGDKDIDAGEKWQISIKIKDIAFYVYLFLDSDDSYISFSDEEEERKKKCSPDSGVGWDFTISSLEIPSNYEIKLTITITDGSGYKKEIEEVITVVEGNPFADIDWGIVGITLLIILGIIALTGFLIANSHYNWRIGEKIKSKYSNFSANRPIKMQRKIKARELEANKFENLIKKSKGFINKSKKLILKEMFTSAVENWKEGINCYSRALEKAPSPEENNLLILRENICNLYLKFMSINCLLTKGVSVIFQDNKIITKPTLGLNVFLSYLLESKGDD